MKVHVYLQCSVTLLRSWGNSKDVWLNILKKENRYAHCKHFTSLHSSLQPHMRSILLDWLLEVRSFCCFVLSYACEAGRCKQSFYVKDSIAKCTGNAQTSLQQRGYNLLLLIFVMSYIKYLQVGGTQHPQQGSKQQL